MPPITRQKGPVTLYVSHGAGSRHGVDWFIVEPRDRPNRLSQEVERLRRAGRTVIEIAAEPYQKVQ